MDLVSRIGDRIEAFLSQFSAPTRAALTTAGVTFAGLFLGTLSGWLGDLLRELSAFVDDGKEFAIPDVSVLASGLFSAVSASALGLLNYVYRKVQEVRGRLSGHLSENKPAPGYGLEVEIVPPAIAQDGPGEPLQPLPPPVVIAPPFSVGGPVPAAPPGPVPRFEDLDEVVSDPDDGHGGDIGPTLD